MRRVDVIVPEGVDDPTRPSGGNHYDLRVCDGLGADGWSVRVHPVGGAWPAADTAARARLARLMGELPDGATVLADGLIASAAPAELVPHAVRLCLVVLVHMPLGAGTGSLADDAEAAVLGAAAAVVTTSRWTRDELVRRYGLSPQRIHVAVPGVDPAGVLAGTAAGDRLLCVAAIIPGKGHDVLIDALAAISDRPWRCVCAGSIERDPAFVADLGRRIRDRGLDGRITLTGALDPDALAAAYADADLLVLPTRGETYGMVVTEALARGLPVVASDVGGVGEALGTAPDGDRPGMLVPPNVPAALADALRTWLDDRDLRARLRAAARGRRTTLTPWSHTSTAVAGALVRAAA